MPKKKGAENCMRNSYNYYNSTREPKLVVRNERDVMLKPAVTSITSVVARCLPFQNTQEYNFTFLFRLAQLKVMGRIVIGRERFYDGFFSMK